MRHVQHRDRVPREEWARPPDIHQRAACRAVLARQAGYRRQLALVADGWRRVVDLALFDSPEAVLVALASDAWRAVAADHPTCRAAAPAILVSECAYGGPVVLLRTTPGPTNRVQACWRDHLANAEPGAVL